MCDAEVNLHVYHIETQLLIDYPYIPRTIQVILYHCLPFDPDVIKMIPVIYISLYKHSTIFMEKASNSFAYKYLDFEPCPDTARSSGKGANLTTKMLTARLVF